MMNEICPQKKRKRQDMQDMEVECKAYLPPELVERAKKLFSDSEGKYISLEQFLKKAETVDLK